MKIEIVFFAFAGVKVEGTKQQTAAERQEEMDQLYGKDSSQIHKLETSLQLKYNRFCDTHKPELWMAIPLNPDIVAAEWFPCATVA